MEGAVKVCYTFLRSTMLKWLERLDYGAESHRKVVKFKAGLCHATTGKLSLSTEQ